MAAAMSLSTEANTMGVFLDSQAHCPGDVIDGVVCLNLASAVDSPGIYLKVSPPQEKHCSTSCLLLATQVLSTQLCAILALALSPT